MSHYLVKYEADYADEFDVHGIAIFTAKDYEEWKGHFLDAEKYFANGGKDIELGFGTNEWIDVSDVESYRGMFKTENISEQTYDELYRAFGNRECFGHFLEVQGHLD